MAALRRLNMASVEQIDRLQADLVLTDDEIAAALAVPIALLARWRSGASSPRPAALERLQDLAALSVHLHDTFRTPGGPRWLRSESRYLGGQTPLDALRNGEFGRVESALEALDSGIFV